jgi:hypothetical protein
MGRLHRQTTARTPGIWPDGCGQDGGRRMTTADTIYLDPTPPLIGMPFDGCSGPFHTNPSNLNRLQAKNGRSIVGGPIARTTADNGPATAERRTGPASFARSAFYPDRGRGR